MDPATITTDQIIVWHRGLIVLNATILYTWAIMLVIIVTAWLATRRLTPGAPISRWQNVFEVIVIGMHSQVRAVSQRESVPYFGFVSTLFVFIAVSNLLSIVPGYYPPTGSLSTTAALAVAVFLAVPAFGIAEQGLLPYLKQYAQPNVFMLPFNILGELSRTLALAVRLFGNVMSGTKIVVILLGIAPLFFPIVMQLLGLLTGLLHAYIFALLATVYIASASRSRASQGEADPAV